MSPAPPPAHRETSRRAPLETRGSQPYPPLPPESGFPTALAVLKRLKLSGASVRIDEADLVVRGRVPPDLLEVLRGCKAHALVVLQWLHDSDGPGYPPAGVELRPTHHLDGVPVACRMHAIEDPSGQPVEDRIGFGRFGSRVSYRVELLRCRQPDGDGVLGWVMRSDSVYHTLVRERGSVKTLPMPARENSSHLKEIAL